MADKPKRASEYGSAQVALVRSTCLYVATKLGDMMDDVVVVGGLVPSLLIDQGALPEGVAAHVGTMDLDVGLKLALLDEGRYRTLTERLRDAGFVPDQTDEGRPARQRWRAASLGAVTVDFLIPPSMPNDQGGKLRNIEKDFAAIIAPGLKLAFQDRRRVRIEGKTISGEKAARAVWVCGPGAFVVLKALAFLGRGENKDAYDLYYLIRNFGAGIGEVAACLQPLLADDEAKKAVQNPPRRLPPPRRHRSPSGRGVPARRGRRRDPGRRGRLRTGVAEPLPVDESFRYRVVLVHIGHGQGDMGGVPIFYDHISA